MREDVLWINRVPAPDRRVLRHIRDEDERKRELARQGSLQSHVDELRQGLREFASRQVRLEEVVKSYEGMVAAESNGH